MTNGIHAPAAVSSRTRKNLSPGDRVRRAARFVVEALEGRVLLTSTWTDLSNATAAWTGSNWSPSGYPNASAAVATTHVATTVNETISLGQNITVGSLTLGSSSSAGYSETIASGNTLTFNNGSSAATLTLSGTAPVTLACNIALAGNLTISVPTGATLTISGNISGSGNITESGGGTLTLSGSNTFTGNTTVSGSTLILSNAAGSATGTGTVTVSGTHATLAGTGSASGAVTIGSGGILAPSLGSTPLTLGSLSFLSGSGFTPTLNSDTPNSGYTQVDVTGAVSINSNTNFNMTVCPSGDLLPLINSGSGITGAFRNFPNAAMETATVGNNYFWYVVDYAAVNGDDFTLIGWELVGSGIPRLPQQHPRD